MSTEKTAKPAAASAVKKPAGIAPVKAVVRINGTIVPGDMFRPASAAARTELVETLAAAVDLSDAELALFEKTEVVGSDDPADPIG